MIIDIPKLKRKASRKKRHYELFLKKLKRKKPSNIQKIAKQIDAEVWQEIDCLSCANCCKTMVPTYTRGDMKRIADHFGITSRQLYDKYLAHDENNDIVNQSTPCQWLGKDNKCKIYDIRPRDCRGFPHLKRSHFFDQSETFINNIKYCPATMRMLEILEERASILK